MPAPSGELTQTDRLNKSLLSAFLRRMDDGSAPTFPAPEEDAGAFELEEQMLEAAEEEPSLSAAQAFSSDADLDAFLAEHKDAVDVMKEENRAAVGCLWQRFFLLSVSLCLSLSLSLSMFLSCTHSLIHISHSNTRTPYPSLLSCGIFRATQRSTAP
jgi:hypothetical protein